MEKDTVFFQMTNKLLSLYCLVRHSRVPKALRYYCRHTYYCQINQLRYFIKDYLQKKQYKVVSFDGEFSCELDFVLPHVYWHYKNGTLLKTRSSKFTKELYFFSPDHEECFDERVNEGNYNFDLPRIIYSHNYNMKKWERVPLKETYQNDVYVFEKPTLIIANRYNTEWDGPPVSYLDIPTLDYLINKLKDKYTIVYNRAQTSAVVADNSVVYDLNEFSWLKEEHPEVLLLQDLYKENKGKANNFNHLQLMVYANADRFISTHGGMCVLASYFGGVNTVLSRKGPEHYFKCFEKLHQQLSGAKVLHAKNEDELKKYIEAYY